MSGFPEPLYALFCQCCALLYAFYAMFYAFYTLFYALYTLFYVSGAF